MKNEIGALQEGNPSGKFFDRVSPIPQDPFVAVYISDGTSAGTGVGEARVVGDQTEIPVVHLDLPKVERPHRSISDLELVFTAGCGCL